MSQSKIKTYKRMLKRENEKNYKRYIFEYANRLCREPFRVKVSYMWMIFRSINPHTGEKVKHDK
jgi:hypothetical protein